jgi:hypothetical protein
MLLRTVMTAVILAATPPSPSTPTVAPRVCPDPDKPCPGFAGHDLSFPLPDDGVARPDARSAPFLAVLLRTTERCAIQESQRLEVQGLFPRHKVFATRFECDNDVENNVTYTNVDGQYGFLAVYAGENQETAKETLATALARFPGANLRTMQVVFTYP